MKAFLDHAQAVYGPPSRFHESRTVRLSPRACLLVRRTPYRRVWWARRRWPAGLGGVWGGRLFFLTVYPFDLILCIAHQETP